MYALGGLGLQPLPRSAHGGRGEGREALEGEAAPQARRDAAGDLRRLDGDRARAAARVVQRAALLRRAAPAGRGEHRGGERLLQRRIALVLAPAALEQRRARGVDIQDRALAAEVQQQRQVGAMRVHARPLAARLAQRVADRVLDTQCREVEAAQRRALRRGVDLQGLARRQPLRPVDRPRQRVEIVLVAIRALGDLDQHALRQPALEVQAHGVDDVGVQRDAAALRVEA
jgi:hypothetical protein